MLGSLQEFQDSPRTLWRSVKFSLTQVCSTIQWRSLLNTFLSSRISVPPVPTFFIQSQPFITWCHPSGIGPGKPVIAVPFRTSAPAPPVLKFDWDQDPQLADLSRALWALGWAPPCWVVFQFKNFFINHRFFQATKLEILEFLSLLHCFFFSGGFSAGWWGCCYLGDGQMEWCRGTTPGDHVILLIEAS